MTFLQNALLYGLFIFGFYFLLVAVLNFLPPGIPLPSEFISGVQLMFAYLRGIDFILPMQTYFTILISEVALLAFLWIFDLALWVLNLVRGRAH